MSVTYNPVAAPLANLGKFQYRGEEIFQPLQSYAGLMAAARGIGGKILPLNILSCFNYML